MRGPEEVPEPKQPPRPFPDAAPDRCLVQWKWRANSPRHWHVRGMAAMSSAAIPESLCSANIVWFFVPESVAHLTARQRDGCSVGFSIQLEHRKLARHPPWQSLLLLVISPVHSESACECKVVPSPVGLGT